MADVKDKSRLNEGSTKILTQAADALVKHTTELLKQLKQSLKVGKKQKKQMSSESCRDFLFTVISNPVIFYGDEAKENIGFLDEGIVEKILGDLEGTFNPNNYWSEEDNFDICHLVLKIASRHFTEEYESGQFAQCNIRHALASAAMEWADEGDSLN